VKVRPKRVSLKEKESLIRKTKTKTLKTAVQAHQEVETAKAQVSRCRQEKISKKNLKPKNTKHHELNRTPPSTEKQ
jgi:hypothetical protein